MFKSLKIVLIVSALNLIQCSHGMEQRNVQQDQHWTEVKSNRSKHRRSVKKAPEKNRIREKIIYQSQSQIEMLNHDLLCSTHRKLNIVIGILRDIERTVIALDKRLIRVEDTLKLQKPIAAEETLLMLSDPEINDKDEESVSEAGEYSLWGSPKIIKSTEYSE